MRIVVDAMGSDKCPVPDVAGAIQAARETGDTILLTGDKVLIEQEIAKQEITGLNLEVIHTSQIVTMHDHPSEVGRTKPDSSMRVGLNLVRDQKADAFVTAGNTGAALAIATLYSLRRIHGVKRPALATLINTGTKTVVLADLGANSDSRPEWMVQFGIMGSLYIERVLGRENPTVALLSNGEEEGKGNALVRETAALFPASGLNFIGNIEPKEMLEGKADVIIADGFVGNIALKSLEAVGDLLFDWLRAELTTPFRLLGAFLLRATFRKMYRRVDPFEIGGAPLLGVNGVVIIGHGRTNAKGIKNAVFQARKAVQGQIVEAIREGMAHSVSEEPSDV